jgi:hypothetical protein
MTLRAPSLLAAAINAFMSLADVAVAQFVEPVGVFVLPHADATKVMAPKTRLRKRVRCRFMR